MTGGQRTIAVSARNLTVRYGGVAAIDNVCIDIVEGDYLGIIGPNGGGKTTLLKAILGMVRPSEGEVRIYGKKPSEAGGIVGYVPQVASMNKTFPATVREVVAMAKLKPEISFFHKYSPEELNSADVAMENAGILDLGNKKVSELSGGQFQRMLIARAISHGPRVLLLDEPTANVDATSRTGIYELLEKLNGNMTIVMVTHDMLAVSSQVRSLACLNVRLVYHGESEISDETIHELYGCPIDLLAHGVPHRVLRQHKDGE
jgi:zinc transport system ATP-binding protein